MRAVIAGNAEIVEYLIGQGADLDQRDDFGDTALEIAKKIDEDEIVELLVAATEACKILPFVQQKEFVFRNVNAFGKDALYNRYDAYRLELHGRDCDINYNGTIYFDERDCRNSTHQGM